MPLYDRITRSALHATDPYTLDGKAPEPRVWPYLRAHLGPLRVIILASLVMTVLVAGIEVWLIAFAGQLIDLLATTPPAEVWTTHKVTLLIAGAVILVMRPLAMFARGLVNEISLEGNVAALLRWRAHHHLSRQSVGWFQRDLSGRVASRLVDIGNHGATTLYQSLNTLAYGVVYIVGVILLMAGTDLRLVLPLLIWFVIYAGAMAVIIPAMVRAQKAFHGARSLMLGTVVDNFTNFDTMKLFADEATVAEDIRSKIENTRFKLFLTRRIGVTMNTVLAVLEGVIMVGFVGYGVYLYTQEAATLGLISAAIALTFRITAMAEWLKMALWDIFLRVGSLKDSLLTISQPIDIPDAPDAVPLQVPHGRIEIDSIQHHYGKAKGGLNNVSLTIEPGEKVALVGHSGAGKSTLVNLMLRFHQAEAGSIRIDGQDIRDVRQDSLRAAIGMVSQQASMLNRSVRDNIALGQIDMSQDAVEAAARKAIAHDFILGLRDGAGRTGYDVHMGERGVKLSGGQRQRIALARVILKNAPILILDEATSALDSEVEAEIQAVLEEVMQDKTVIAIAHRLSTVAKMDRIIVLEDGQIVEEGTHTGLLAKGGRYAQFWDRQSGGFLEPAGET